jgi:diacylglycerol kinase family enzyme
METAAPLMVRGPAAECLIVSQTDTCVILNPMAGQGRARLRLKRLREALGPRAEFWCTRAAGEGEELAQRAAEAGFAFVGAAGGDGTIHEVANGILRAARPEVALAVFPIGSANDYAASLGLMPDWWRRERIDQGVCPVDVGIVKRPDGRTRYFINGLGLGFNAGVTLERNRIPWLRGVALYSLGLLAALCFRFGRPMMKLTITSSNGQAEPPLVRQVPTLALTVAIGRREGNFLLAPNARLDDGLFDYLQAGALKRWELVRHLPDMISGDLPLWHPQLWTGRCQQMEVESETPLAVHLDGELFTRPEDQAHRIEASIVKHALRVKAGTLSG